MVKQIAIVLFCSILYSNSGLFLGLFIGNLIDIFVTVDFNIRIALLLIGLIIGSYYTSRVWNLFGLPYQYAIVFINFLMWTGIWWLLVNFIIKPY